MPRPMRSILVEVHREGSVAREALFAPDRRYIITFANEPARLEEIGLSFHSFRSLLRRLDYSGDNEEDQASAIEEFSSVVTRLIRSDSFDWLAANDNNESDPIQIDLVLNPGEISALPFEVARSGSEYLLNGRPPVVVTRRVRRVTFQERRRTWPHKPRVLYIWASPKSAGNHVPHRNHFKALLTALKPWIEPLKDYPSAADYRSVLTTLDNSSLAQIRSVCEQSVKDRNPFTHVHILAHGCTTGSDEDPFTERFGVALRAPTGTGVDPVTPEHLSSAISSLRPHCVAVTLATCYGASQANILVPEGGLAHTVHLSGVPIVIGSQWPLSFPGSELLTKTFYSMLLRGADVREALHSTRVGLSEQADCRLDWASLVGYVSLPEGYADHLIDVSLGASLAALETASKWADRLVKDQSRDVRAFERVQDQLMERIEELQRLFDASREHQESAVLLENLGLLGSAHKRLAELLHHWSMQVEEEPARKDRMLAALRSALQCYEKGFKNNFSNHWLGTQWLSLQAVLTGRIDEPDYWTIALHAAKQEKQGSGRIWALGSIAELWLIAGTTKQQLDLEKSTNALREMRSCARDEFSIYSTKRQLNRYCDWWTTSNGFFPGMRDLSVAARSLLEVLEARAP